MATTGTPTSSSAGGTPTQGTAPTQGTVPALNVPVPQVIVPQNIPPVIQATYMPTKPIMGDIKQVGGSDYAAWTGGVPRHDWSGLEDPTPVSVEPKQYRPSSVGGSSKAQHYRTTGLETKFTRSSDLLVFQKKVMDHLEINGLDTVTYLLDPQDPTRMITIINEHAKFSVAGAGVAEALQAGKYDTYDNENINDAKRFLLDSLDETLLKQVHETCESKDTFITYWMQLMLILRPISIEQYDTIKNRLKGRKIKDYAGENVETLASDFLSDWKELDGAGMYDHNLTHTMIKIIMEGGGATNEDFRSDLRDLKKKINTKLLEIRHKSAAQQTAAMARDKLDVQSVLTEAKRVYRQVVEEGKWPAAQHATDSKALKRNYGGSVNMVNAVNALKQALSIGGQTGEVRNKGSCFNCGSPDHWAKDCPKKPRNEGRRPFVKQKGRFNPKKGNGDNPRGRRSGRSGLFPPPKPGESEIKQHNGKKYYFCSKCGCWNLTHGTDAHKTKEELAKAKVGMARVNFDLHPAAYKAKVNINFMKVVPQPSSFAEWYPLLWILLVFLCLGMVWTWVPDAWWTAARTATDTCIDGLIFAGQHIIMALYKNWLHTVLALASGSLGSYATHKSVNHGTTHHTRERKGEAYMKQCRRRARKHFRKQRRGVTNNPFHLKGMPKYDGTWTMHVKTPHYLRNIPRPDRVIDPETIHIRMLRNKIKVTKQEIARLTALLHTYEADLAQALEHQKKRRVPNRKVDSRRSRRRQTNREKRDSSITRRAKANGPTPAIPVKWNPKPKWS